VELPAPATSIAMPIIRVKKKRDQIAALLAGVPGQGVDPHYAGYFACFNRGLYFEAHDVLEELWLPVRGGADGDFYRGLIQIAGAFVHLRKNRLRPADALFALADANLARYPCVHLRFDVAGARRLIAQWRNWLADSFFAANPLGRVSIPRLERLPDGP
jgi:hypothetical protein